MQRLVPPHHMEVVVPAGKGLDLFELESFPSFRSLQCLADYALNTWTQAQRPSSPP